MWKGPPKAPAKGGKADTKKGADAGAQKKATAKKKKWSKGKVKDKAQHAVICDKAIYDKIFKEVPTFKMISQSVLIDRMKINGSLARVAIKHLTRDGLIRPILHHNGQLIYTRTAGDAAE
ncbi:hypothetical protein MNV49_000315 [Pseudohyphozyma bogoriensis]|nr:hypothetical protein MNV49_000315 [Pseudohyphozyma bogoriensis]